MAKPQPIKSLTLEEYERLPDNPRFRDEVSRGQLVREPRPGARHGRVAFEIASRLRAFVRDHDLGSVEMECGFVLASNPLAVRGPDAAFIAKERLPPDVPAGFWPFAPDLAVEVVSPSNTTSELETKVLEYLDAGTLIVWVIDPDTRTARVYSGNEARIVRESDMLSAGDVVPGFSVVLSEILA